MLKNLNKETTVQKPLLHVCTVASHHDKRLDQLIESGRQNGISVKALGVGLPFRGLAEKFIHVRQYLQTLSDQDLLLFVDAYDVLIIDSTERVLQKFLQMKTPCVVSAEKFCYPDEVVSTQYPHVATSFKYLCSGAYRGYVGYLKELIDGLLPFSPQEDDQRLMTRDYLADLKKYTLDTQCEIFLNIFNMSSQELEIDRDHRTVRCIETNSYPCVIHGHGKSLWYQCLYDWFFPKPYTKDKNICKEDKTVLLAVLARNNEELLPKYLECIEKLDYNKQKITLYINSCDSNDQTKAILGKWVQANEKRYKRVIIESEEASNLPSFQSYGWIPQRFKIPGSIRNKSLQKAKEHNCEYYFVVDCDSFIAPFTLKELLSKKMPIIAPMLQKFPFAEGGLDFQDASKNYFCAVTEEGTYQDHPDYLKIAEKELLGTFKVPLVLGTYLIQIDYIDKLSYTDKTRDYEYLVFARSARYHRVDQYICNEEEFGYMIQFGEYLSSEQLAMLELFLFKDR
ncbi:MAG: hypothetical protein JWO53_865 [Chlamydiia bacterium]|nr:hypothetical protein [Chlamydiia bacterium]